MAGGLLNLIAYGNQNIILNGNPSKTFFKCVYAKYTNFGLQKFRVDYSGLRELRMSEKSVFTFKMPRYGDLLMDTYIVLNIPTIWSPIYETDSEYRPYNFKWVKDLGCMLIKEISISAGGQILQQYSGDYIRNLIVRDNYNLALFNEMTGNISELNDPANANDRGGNYPNAYYDSSDSGPEPSIRGRKIYIPIGSWFSFSSKMAFPLVCLQYNELNIQVTMRPVKELFTIQDVTDSSLPTIQPNFNISEQAFYRFIQPPPDTTLSADSYEDKTTSWNADIHLISTYCFLSKDEAQVFSSDEQKYLIKDVREEVFRNISGAKKVKLNSGGMVASWMWFFRRTDAYLRNQWTNYTNWEYDTLPNNVEVFTSDTDLYTSGTFSEYNEKLIMNKFAILLDGKYRENEFDAGIYNYIEKYSASNNSASTDPSLYCYNFEINTSLYDTQPTGAINLSKFTNVEFELTTYLPPVDPSAQYFNICDEDGELIGVNKFSWDIYQYTYDLHVLEERYNIIHFLGGNVSKMFAY